MPTLVILRHAKAESAEGAQDFDRALAPRGHRDAREAGDWIQQAATRPGMVVSSPARRTVETVEEVVTAWGGELPAIVYDESLYEASLGDLLHVVRGLDDDEETVLLVGHDPSMSELVTELTGRSTELRTAGAAVVRVPSSWADAPPGECELIDSRGTRG
jgi:phosphohistidine phosphatase